MAKQSGPNFITGNFQGLCFYKWGNGYFVRASSSLTTKDFKDRSEFARSRKSAADLATASVLASQVYRSLPKEKQNVALYRKMTGMAKMLLKEGRTAEEVKSELSMVNGVNGVNGQWSMVNVGKEEEVSEEKLNKSIAHPSVHGEPLKSTSTNENTLPDTRIQDPWPGHSRYFHIGRRAVVKEINPVVDWVMEEMRRMIG